MPTEFIGGDIGFVGRYEEAERGQVGMQQGRVIRVLQILLIERPMTMGITLLSVQDLILARGRETPMSQPMVVGMIVRMIAASRIPVPHKTIQLYVHKT